MKPRILVLFILFCAWFALFGCASPNPSPTSVTSPLDVPPIPSVAASPLDSPLSDPSTATPEAFVDGDRFRLDKPVNAGDTVVRGQGVPSVQIIIVDVTAVGDVLGQAVVDEQGRFEAKLDVPAEAKHRIGISINASEMDLRCEHCQDIPLVGVILDSVRVEP